MGVVNCHWLWWHFGEEHLSKAIKQYYLDFGFKHPKPEDFIRTVERVSNIELDWYLMDFAQTTNTIDYGIKKVNRKSITLERIGLMPMPIDLKVTYKDGTSEDFYIPLREMRGEKPTKATQLKDWTWAIPTYSIKTDKVIETVEIDSSTFMADVNRENNSYSRTPKN